MGAGSQRVIGLVKPLHHLLSKGDSKDAENRAIASNDIIREYAFLSHYFIASAYNSHFIC